MESEGDAGTRARDELAAILADQPTVDRLLDWWAEHHPDLTAHVVPNVGTMTYGQWRSRSLAAAAGLRRRGVGHGSLVGFSFPRGAVLDFAICLSAAHRLGAVAVLLPVDDHVEDLLRLLESCPLDHLVSPAAGAAGLSGLGCPVVTAEELRASDLDESVPASAAHGHDVATVVFTSGTTNVPKGVAMTHRDLLHETTRRWESIVSGERGTLLHAFPLSVPVGQWAVQVPLLRALRSVTLVEFQPRTFLRFIDTYQVTETAMVPAMAAAMRDLPEDARPRAAALKTVIIGSARCPRSALHAIRDWFPHATLVIDYSSTESGWAGTSIEYGPSFQLGCVGWAREGAQVRIVDDEGRELASGMTGTVELRLPPGVPERFYLNDPVATAATFRGRWVRMADLGYLDEQERLHLVGRTNDVVNLGGRKVSCQEVEQVFESFPGVAEAAAFAMSDPILGEELGIAVAADDGVRADALRRYAQEHLSSHKVPTQIAVLAALPRTRSGKVRKSELPALVRGVSPSSDGAQDVDQLLIELTSEVLGIHDIRGDQSLFELGASSLDVIRIYNKLTKALDVDFDIGFMFIPDSLSNLAKYIEDVTRSDTRLPPRR